MLGFIRSYGANIVFALIVAVAAVLVTVKLIRDKKRGRCTGCSSCPMHGACGKEKNDN